MGKKIKLTRPELKRRRDALALFKRYLPTLKLKQQQLQMSVLQAERRQREAQAQVAKAAEAIAPYRPLLRAQTGVDLQRLTTPAEVRTSTINVAGVKLPVFEEATFPEERYSLFATPPWVDQALADHRELSGRRAAAEVFGEQVRLLRHELTRITQRVNLFEKLKIPETKEAIRVIRIYLGDEQTAAVGRAKIAKSKTAAQSHQPASGSSTERVEAGSDARRRAGSAGGVAAPRRGPER